jgi:hypothetical protein
LNELCGCQLVIRTSISAGARGDVQDFGGCQAPVAPVLTQALLLVVQTHDIHIWTSTKL